MNQDKKNKVKFGLKNAHYALKQVDEEGNVTYGTPKRFPGAVSISLNPEGSSSPFYADDITYFTSNSNNGYSGDLEVADIIEDFKVDVLGEIKDSNGALIENADAVINPFALIFEITGDKKGRRIVLYNVTTSRPSTSAQTRGENSDPQTDTLSFTAAPREDTKDTKAVLEPSAENQEAYDSFFTKVYEQVAA